MSVMLLIAVLAWAAIMLLVIALCQSAARGDSALRVAPQRRHDDGRFARGRGVRVAPRAHVATTRARVRR